MDYWAKDIYSWGIFSAEVYPRSSIAIQRTVRMSWISCPLNDLQMGQQVQNPWNCAYTSGVVHPLSTVCKGHYTLWSALPGLPSPNMASLDYSGSRTTTSGLWQSTPSDMCRCLASSGQHLVDREGSSGSSSGYNRMVPPPLLKRIIGMATAAFPWPTDQPQVWPALVAAFTGLEPPRFLYVGIP